VSADLASRILATVVAAAALSLLAPPANWHWLHWVVYLPMFWALREETPRQNRWLSWLYGTVGVGLLFRWIVATITLFSPIPWIGAVAILALFSGVFGLQYLLLWPSVHWLRRRLGTWWILVFPALEVLIEWVSMHVLLFPYNHGVSQYRVPYTWQLASVTGVWGLSFLVFLVNAAFAEAIYRQREGRPFPVRPVVGALSALASTLVFGVVRYDHVQDVLATAPVLRVAQLQSDKDMLYRMRTDARTEWNEWFDATQAIPPGTVDLVIWPEGASPYALVDNGKPTPRARILSELAARGGFEMVIGAGTRMREPDPEAGEDRVVVFNSTYFFQKDGTMQAHYDKLVPLPFGEYLPFSAWLPEGLGHYLGIGDFRAGEIPVIFEGGQAKIASPICYEAILPGTCRLFRDADLLTVVTNDAWFGDTANPHQHAMLAATRSMELGIPMVRSASTGISFVVEPDGTISSETKPFTVVNRVVEVKLAKFRTPYARFGDWFVALCLVVVLAFSGRLRGTVERDAPAPV
jgi:apolipoprotein N-acyltransferase